jgi:hypothetical protein
MKMRFRCACLAGAAALFLAGMSGCGSGTKTVKGTVTLNGEPFAGAAVTYHPVDPGGRPANGTTDASGNFSLGTYKPGDGALPGAYRVTIGYTEPVHTVAEPGQGAMLTVMKQLQQANKASKKVEPKIPLRYNDEAKSGFKATVPPDGPVKFELTKP